jgi:hypothetical protein
MACDVECQRQKKLKLLQDAYMAASTKAGSDPQGYERAKIAYFTLRDGPTWLHNYKQQKQEQEQEQARRRKQQVEDHSAPQDPGPPTEDSYEFTRYIQQKKDNSDVKWRLFELTYSSETWEWIELALTIILSLYCIYQLYIKGPKFLNYFGGKS